MGVVRPEGDGHGGRRGEFLGGGAQWQGGSVGKAMTVARKLMA